jgi:hypothetical protein
LRFEKRHAHGLVAKNRRLVIFWWKFSYYCIKEWWCWIAVKRRNNFCLTWTKHVYKIKHWREPRNSVESSALKIQMLIYNNDCSICFVMICFIIDLKKRISWKSLYVSGDSD